MTQVSVQFLLTVAYDDLFLVAIQSYHSTTYQFQLYATNDYEERKAIRSAIRDTKAQIKNAGE